MNMRDLIKPLIAALVGIGIIVIVIILLVKLFSGGGAASPQIDISKYAATNSTATLLIDDPTQVDQNHRQVKITVTQSQIEIDILQGYQGTVLDSRTYTNNSAAYGAFIQSLKEANFAKGNSDTDLADYRGYCPSGNRYVYTFNDGSKDLFSYWSTSCGSEGTYKGSEGTTLRLFEKQIPDEDFYHLVNHNDVSLGF